MNYDDIVNVLTGKSNKMVENVLRVIINTHFILDGIIDGKVRIHDRVTNDKYIVLYNKRILIVREDYDKLYLSDNFGFIIEINFNENSFTLSNILNIESPEGIVTSTTNWFYDGAYKEEKGRICLLREHDLDTLSNKQTIKSFIDNFYIKRSNVFNDLFWDLDLLRKSLLIDSVMNKTLLINNTSDDFSSLYKEILITMSNIMEEVV